LRWAAALVVLGLLLHFLPVGAAPCGHRASSSIHILCGAAGYLLAHGIGVLKWRMVVNAAGAELDFLTSAQCYAAGLFGTLFLPSIVGGDVVRLAWDCGAARVPRRC